MNHPPPSQPLTPGKARFTARAQWRSYFHDHPKLAVDRDQANSTGGKPKLYCKQCFSLHMDRLRSQDQQELHAGKRVEVREHEVLAAYRVS